MRIRALGQIVVANVIIACANAPSGPLMPLRDSIVLVNDIDEAGWPRDFIALDSASVNAQGRLTLYTIHGGGCVPDHRFALLVGRAFAETAPPMLQARIAHDRRNDFCKALIFRTIEVDLAPLRNHYERMYGTRGGAFVLEIAGQRVRYEFN